MKVRRSVNGITMLAVAWARPRNEQFAGGTLRWPGYIHLHLGRYWVEWIWR